jgi:hypothetical protein
LTRAKSDNAEFRLQVAIAEHLRNRAVPGVYWTAIPNGEKRSAITGARLKRMGVRAGNPDFLLIKKGRCFGLELKALRIGKRGEPLKGQGQSEAQIAVENDWLMAGGVYAVATGATQALRILEAWDLIRPDRSIRPVYSPTALQEKAS